MKKKTKKTTQPDIIEEATSMYNNLEGDEEIENLSGLEAAEDDIIADEDEDFMGAEIDEMDGLDELEDVGDAAIAEPLQAAADAVADAADAAGVELAPPGEDALEDELLGDEELLDDAEGMVEDEVLDDELPAGDVGMTSDELNMETYEMVMGEILKEETPAWARSQKSAKTKGQKNDGNYDEDGKKSPAKSHNGENEGIPAKGDVGARQNHPEDEAQDGVDGAPTDDGVVEPTVLNTGTAAANSPAKSHNGSNETIAQKADHGMNKNVSVPGPDGDGVNPDIEVHTKPTGTPETAVGGAPVNKGSFGTGAKAGYVNQSMVNLAASYKPDEDFNKKAEAIFENTMKKHFSKKSTK